MPARLTLVADNSQSPDRLRTRSSSRPDHSRSPSAVPWVHSAWVPRRARYRRTRTDNGTDLATAHHPAAGQRNAQTGTPDAGETERTRGMLADDRGAVTAEYAIVIMAGVAFAGLMVAIMRSGEIRQMLVDLVQNALGAAG